MKKERVLHKQLLNAAYARLSKIFRNVFRVTDMICTDRQPVLLTYQLIPSCFHLCLVEMKSRSYLLVV